DEDTLRRLSPGMLELVSAVLPAKEARDWLVRAQPLHADDFWVNFQLAGLMQKDNPQQAEAYFRAALALRPTAPVAWSNLGASLAFQGDHAAAQWHFRKALALDPRFAWAWYNLGLSYLLQKDYAAAARHLDKALDIDPRFAPAHVSRGIVCRALKDDL